MYNTIKVGFCIAYDWHLLKYSLPLVYNFADQICLAVDKDRISWTGRAFDIDEKAFSEFVQTIDKRGKIKLYEDNFHISDLTPMQNEVRQRNMIAAFQGNGGWHIQLDCDEYFVDFEGFVSYLKTLPADKTSKANVCCQWVVLFKQTEDGFLYVDPQRYENLEFMQIATKEPRYEYGRRNGDFNLYTNFKLIHQSWARPEQEIREKIYNWGHSNDFEKKKYLDFWNSLNTTNYAEAINFHLLNSQIWPSLKYIAVGSLNELIHNPELFNFPSLSRRQLYFKNSRFLSRLRKLSGIVRKKILRAST